VNHSPIPADTTGATWHPKCRHWWTGNRTAHCGNCHRTFSGTSAFDQHQTAWTPGTDCPDPRTRGLIATTKKYGDLWSWPAQDPTRRQIRYGSDHDATGHAEAPEYPSEGEALRGAQNGAQDLRTPQAWCDRYGLDIRDPDGWRGKDAPSWETPITLPDFWRRFGQSTVSGITNTDYDRIIADVRAAKQNGDQQ
jgi:hypothetical protein